MILPLYISVFSCCFFVNINIHFFSIRFACDKYFWCLFDQLLACLRCMLKQSCEFNCMLLEKLNFYGVLSCQSIWNNRYPDYFLSYMYILWYNAKQALFAYHVLFFFIIVKCLFFFFFFYRSLISVLYLTIFHFSFVIFWTFTQNIYFSNRRLVPEKGHKI